MEEAGLFGWVFLGRREISMIAGHEKTFICSSCPSITTACDGCEGYVDGSIVGVYHGHRAGIRYWLEPFPGEAVKSNWRASRHSYGAVLVETRLWC